MRTLLIVALCALLAACGGCETGLGPRAAAKDPDRITVATWNVQALFDGRVDGTEYPDYAGSSGWTEEKYRERLDRIGQAVSRIADGGPDVLVLLETENAAVAEALASGPLASCGYRWYARAGNPGAALGLSVFSRYPLSRTVVHGVSSRGEEAPRPILEARVDAGTAPLVIFACHWKSKLGGDAQTEPMRRASASVVARRLERLALDEPGLDALVLGDLNESYDEFVLRGGRYATALLPDTETAEKAAARDGAPRPLLVIADRAPPAAAAVVRAVPVFSPWPSSSWPGSYAYRQKWEKIDHILANANLFDGRGWEYSCFRVVDAEPLTAASGYPAAYNPRTGAGYSDHLPLAVELVRAR
jgi:endonuclease/exonuclease/phosphatase family metal-dependent hydrolase